MAVQLRHCPVPAVARPFRLLALQQREGIAPRVGAGHRRADHLHQPGVGRELRTRPDARSLTRSATGRRCTKCGSSPATPTSGRPSSTSSARKKTPRWRPAHPDPADGLQEPVNPLAAVPEIPTAQPGVLHDVTSEVTLIVYGMWMRMLRGLKNVVSARPSTSLASTQAPSALRMQSRRTKPRRAQFLL